MGGGYAVFAIWWPVGRDRVLALARIWDPNLELDPGDLPRSTRRLPRRSAGGGSCPNTWAKVDHKAPQKRNTPMQTAPAQPMKAVHLRDETDRGLWRMRVTRMDYMSRVDGTNRELYAGDMSRLAARPAPSPRGHRRGP